MLPNPWWKHLFESPDAIPEVLNSSHSIFSDILSTNEVLFWLNCLRLLVLGKIFNLMLIFSVPGNTCTRSATWAIDERRLINFVNFKSVVWEFRYNSWQCFITFWIFFSVIEMIICEVSIIKPKNYTCCEGWSTDLFRFITKPKLWRANVNVPMLIKIFSIVWPIKRMCSRYITCEEN